MKRFYTVFSCFIVLLSSGLQVDAGPTDPVSIPDSALRGAIETRLGKSAGATITESEMNGINNDFTYEGTGGKTRIGNLTGLEHATGITSLTLRYNNISDLSPLSGLTQLTELYLDGNPMTSLSDLSNLTSLKKLYVSLTGQPRPSNANLSPLTNLTALTELDLTRWGARDISALANLTALKILYLPNNRIKNISSLRRLTKLESLDLDDNFVKDISPLRNLTKLKKLQINLNNISDLSPLVALMRQGQLENLDIRFNPLNYESRYTHLPALISGISTVRFDPDTPGRTMSLERVSKEASVGPPGTRHTFVVKVVFRGIGHAKAPVKWTGTSPARAAVDVLTGADGLSRFSITLGGPGEKSTVRAEIPAKSNTNGPSHDIIGPVTFTATADPDAPPLVERIPPNPVEDSRPIPRKLNVPFEDSPKRPDVSAELVTDPPEEPEKEVSVFVSKVAMNPMIFNEICNASDDKNDWIELKNITDEEVNLTDYEISIVIKSAPKMFRNTAEIAKEDVDIVTFPEDSTLPPGGILLIVNTHPRETDLIEGQDITDEESDPDMLPQYLIASEMKLPDVPYLLILRSARDKNGKPEAFEDLAGNYFRGFVDYGTQIFPLMHTARPANHLIAKLTQGQAWQRVDRKKRGYTKAAWAVSGYQSGIGYKPKSALETSLGTPGYPNGTVADDSLAGRITFSEVMYATRGGLFSAPPQWIELYNNTDTAMLPINLKGWRLVVEARDSKHRHRYSVIELASDLYIAPTRTVLLVTRNRRHSGHLTEGQVYNLNRHNRGSSKLGLRENKVLPAKGFALQLLSPDGTLVDSAGNLDGKRFVDPPRWELPSGYTEDGVRTSLLRKYADNVALDGTLATSWVRAADVVLPLALYYGHETDIGSPGHREGGVAPVMLSHFQARRTDAGVMVEWSTVSETDTAGFNILRGQTKDGAFVKVNPTLIHGAGTTGDKQQYTYRDPTAKADVPYYYRLEEISLSGERRAVATVGMRGHLSATGKYLWKWSDVKTED